MKRIHVLALLKRSGSLLAVLASGSIAFATNGSVKNAPIVLKKQGSYSAGGSTLRNKVGSSVCDHGFVEYQIPIKPRSIGLFLWHSSSTAIWQNRWDGGDGFQSLFLRRGFPTYLWDGPRVGRASLPCENIQTPARIGQDQASFMAWRFGPSYLQWYPGVQFPVANRDAWNQAIRARYEEFDTVDNIRLQAHAAAEAFKRTGPVVVMTNSAAGVRAMLAAIESHQVKAIIAYESVGFVLPDTEDKGAPPGPYGPIYVPLDQFRTLARIPMQFVWGDHLDQPRGPQMALPANRHFVNVVNQHGGKAEIVELAKVGLTGNTHMPFADLNNVAVADLAMGFLKKHGLDRRGPLADRTDSGDRP